MSDLQGQIGEVRMTIQIKRAATGETETHELIGKVMDEVTACQTDEVSVSPPHMPDMRILRTRKAQDE